SSLHSPMHIYSFFLQCARDLRVLHSFPTRRSSDLGLAREGVNPAVAGDIQKVIAGMSDLKVVAHVDDAQPLSTESTSHVLDSVRSEEHTSELQSRGHLVCRLLLEKKKKTDKMTVRL